MTNFRIRNTLVATAAACVGLLAGLTPAAHAAAAADDAARRQPPGATDAKTYAFTSTERLLAFMEKRAPGWTGVDASTASGTARALTVSARGTVQRRLHVFALVPASAASDQDDAVRKVAAAVQRPAAQPPIGAAQPITVAEARPARYATLSAALPEGAEAGYVLYWSGQSAFGETNPDVWADRPIDELVAAARSWPSWLYVYAVGLDGVPRLVRGGGNLAVLEHAIERPLASAMQGRVH